MTPAQRDAAFARIAAGAGREATFAHPLCLCHRPYTPTCRICRAKPNQPCRHQWGDPLVLSPAGRAEQHFRARPRPGRERDCPMHRPTRGQRT